MKNMLLLFALLSALWFTAGCASTPEGRGPIVTQEIVANPGVGFRGYELPVVSGYAVINRDIAWLSPMFQSWLEEIDSMLETIRLQPELSDHVFLLNGNRYLLFFIEQIHTHVPFSHLAPDHRQRLFRLADSNLSDRLQVRAGIQRRPSTFERIGGKDVLWRVFPEEARAIYAFSVLGNLNEIYYLTGTAYEGEGPQMEEDIRAFISGLRF